MTGDAAPRRDSLRLRLTDDEVVARIRGGESELFEVLMRRHNERVYRAVRAVVRTDDAAEEVAQEAWIRAWRHLGQFRGDARFSTWLTTIAVREALQHHRRAGRQRPPLETIEMLEDRPSEAHGPQVAASSAELRAVLERAVDALPEPLRVAFVLREVQGLSTSEAAGVLALSEGALKVRLHRARRELRTVLEQQIGAELQELFAFAGARCDRIVAAVLDRLSSL